MHVAIRLLAEDHEIIGIDNLNDYYDVQLKHARLNRIGSSNQFHFAKIDLCNRSEIYSLFADKKPEVVINLAAQAGVRYSLENPHQYIESNLVGFTNILECCRHFKVQNLVYASSSSVYGLNEDMPFHEGQNVDHPITLYGATKKANELLAHSYSHLFGLPTTGLRFFTVYGPWGQPDMALFKFTKAILEGQAIDIYNQGNMIRDFTYIDDIVEGILRTAYRKATPDPNFDFKRTDAGTSSAPWRIFNIGNNQPQPLMDYISAIERALDLKAEKNLVKMQPGDVPNTYADQSRLVSWTGFSPRTSIDEGIKKFVDWYKFHYRK